VQLRHSPFLRRLPEASRARHASSMGRRADEKLNAGVARELCPRTAWQGDDRRRLSRLERSYLISLNFLNCQTGHQTAIEKQQTQAASAEAGA